MAPQTRINDHYTMHSIKRGAAFYVWEAAAAHKISVDDVLKLLKHKELETALEYCPCPMLAAKACGSQVGGTAILCL
jgi:hypothetical protein